jgi:pimeloyl-ACP methyl ester carboxylesterase
MDRYRERYGSTDYRQATGVMREVFVQVVNESYEAELARLRCPTLLLWGRNDTAAPLGQAEQGAAICSTATLRVIEGGHDLHLSQPDVFVDAIDSLLPRP